MKLKYYMRGVGIGIIFTVFVFAVIVIPNLEFEEITQLQENVNKQINESKVSGLLGQGDKQTSESDTPQQDPSQSPEPAAEPTEAPTPTPEPTEAPTPTPTPTEAPTPTPTPTEAPTPTPTPTEAPTPTPTPTKAPTPTPTPTKAPTPASPASDSGSGGKVSVQKNSDGSFSVTIRSGCTSEILSAALEKAGATDSSADLNKYIVRNGYASRIQTGTFKIKNGADYKDIATAVSSKK